MPMTAIVSIQRETKMTSKKSGLMTSVATQTYAVNAAKRQDPPHHASAARGCATSKSNAAGVNAAALGTYDSVASVKLAIPATRPILVRRILLVLKRGLGAGRYPGYAMRNCANEATAVPPLTSGTMLSSSTVTVRRSQR